MFSAKIRTSVLYIKTIVQLHVSYRSKSYIVPVQQK